MLLNEINTVEENSAPLVLDDVNINDPVDNEILIRVSTCGVCHTELDQIEGRIKPAFMPIILGHQIIGNIEKCGPGATKYKEGTRVGVAWIGSSCGDCTFCESGRENLCSSYLSTGKDLNGGYAEFHLANENYVYKIPDSIEDRFAAPLLCAGSIGYRSLSLTGASDGDSIGLMGFGASGHIVMKLLKGIYPNSEVYVFSRNAQEKTVASDLGASWTGGIEEYCPKKLKCIIDTTPAWKPVVESLKNLQPSGRLVINAIRKESNDIEYLKSINYPKHLWMEKEIKSVANVTRDDVSNFLKLAESLQIKPIVHQYDLTEANDALIDLKFGKKPGAKILKI